MARPYGSFSVLCTAKFRNLATSRVRGSQVFRFDRDGSKAYVVGQSPEWAAELDTQAFVRAGDWIAVLHHQAHKSLSGVRAGVELVPLRDFFNSSSDLKLVAHRQPLPYESELAFPVSLAYSVDADLLAVGINGRDFKSAIYLYDGVAAGWPRLARRIDLSSEQDLRPSAIAFVSRDLWVASYSGGVVTGFADPLGSCIILAREVGIGAPLGLHGHSGTLYATSHLNHHLVTVQGGMQVDGSQLQLNHPWGLTGRVLEDGGMEMLVANLNLDERARSWIASCTDRSANGFVWKRLELMGGSDLAGFSAVHFD